MLCSRMHCFVLIYCVAGTLHGKSCPGQADFLWSAIIVS